MNQRRPLLSLTHVFVLLLAAIAVMLALLFTLLTNSSRASILEISERVRSEVAERTQQRVTTWLGRAQGAMDDVEGQIQHGVVDPDDPLAIEAALYGRMLATPDLGELAFTHGVVTGYDDGGDATLADGGRWQVLLERTHEGALDTRYAWMDGPNWVRDNRERGPEAGLRAVDFARSKDAVDDPTAHLTFVVPASNRVLDMVTGPGHGLWTDLHYAEADTLLPPEQRRVVVAVMKRAQIGDRFVGVLRASIDAGHLGQLMKQPSGDPHRVFVVDDQGRFVTGLSGNDALEEEEDALRVHVTNVPEEVAAALAQPVDVGDMATSTRFLVGRRAWLATFLGLPNTQDWRLVIVVPEDFYLKDLQASRVRLLKVAALLLLGIVIAGALLLRAVQRALGEIARSAARVNNFDFAATAPTGNFRDVRDVLDSIERSKTALRAMGKYVPVDLVRLLYKSNKEPMLGGEMADVTMLFTDIAGFTSISEQLEPNVLARVLGRYLEVMTRTIHAEQGTIDKYIGDAVMALWNVPTRCDQPEVRAVRAALACVKAIKDLEASPEWTGLPSIYTRFGIHVDQVMVGHFGAPDRLSYTVLGDGVNLASRLEGLNKQYGTTVLVSEQVERVATGSFAFRMLDLVAVKGKKKPVRVFEVLGPAGSETDETRRYEQAFERYLARDFAGALALVEGNSDGPSKVLTKRCRMLIEAPPPADWDGVFVAMTK